VSTRLSASLVKTFNSTYIVDSISEDDFKEQVEIIGWMYQYYISEKKDEVFEGLKKNIKITKENIPAATQLFTPDWIVKYMVENSLGRLWLEGHPDEELKNNWKYYLEEAEQEAEVQKQLDEIRNQSRDLKAEDIKVLDPAMGSGHILVYAFDVLYDIYKSSGYAERDIPKLILKNNLYGIDIDDRAVQLAYFAVMMKARSKSRRILNQIRDENLNLNLCAIHESNGISMDALQFFLRGADVNLKTDVEYLVKVFYDAKEYGAILDVKDFDFKSIERRLAEIKRISERDIEVLGHYNQLRKKLTYFIKQARILSERYNVVCTNPPYMANKGMSPNISKFVKENYPKTKSDLFSVFIEKCLALLTPLGHIGMMTSYTWMFLSSYSQLRYELLENHTITSLVQPEYHAFFEEAYVPICSFTLRNKYTVAKGEYIKLTAFYGANQQPIKLKEAISNRYCGYRFSVSSTNFLKIAGAPIAYWASNQVINIFNNNISLSDVTTVKQGLITGDNNKFLRLWYEVSSLKIEFPSSNTKTSELKWFPYNKGGDFRKWYGNNQYVVEWENDGFKLKNFKDSKGKLLSRPQNLNYYFKEGITWSKITAYKIAFRFNPEGFIFSDAGPSLFAEKKYLFLCLGLLCSNVSWEILQVINPTLNSGVGDISTLPFIIPSEDKLSEINQLVKNNIEICKRDWDLSETSWDFSKHPILKFRNSKIQIAYEQWLKDLDKNFNLLKRNEENLNRLFMNIYNLSNELKADVENKDISVWKADKIKDIKSLLSYAIGCMFGRFSLDTDSLIYAGGEWEEKWKNKKVRRIMKDEKGNVISNTWVDATFIPVKDNVIPITDDEYFEEDIVSRLIDFLKFAFSEETLDVNLDFIADAIGKKPSETSRQTIRRYFLKDFYKDHLQIYQKRPIYWLFDSGKQDGFKALIYMHRYDEFTVAKLRTDYLHKLQKSYEAEVKRLNVVIEASVSEREKTNARKKREKILKQMEECLQYDQVIAHVANQRINIDLDDGVSVNYAKFQEVEIPQGEGKKPLKANLLAKI
jgi:type II restriction/modification system DNA methylase subunit YeeA